MNIPENLKYSKSHEWVRIEGDTAVVGITDHAQEALGDITFVELPETGGKLESNGTFGVVESVKAASDLYAPLAGEISEVNEALADEPELVNESPYEKGWLIKLKGISAGEADSLLDSEAYAELIKNET
ncbi:MAG: glycine cleavage system protein GcvH [Kiritimatiellia bacterium]